MWMLQGANTASIKAQGENVRQLSEEHLGDECKRWGPIQVETTRERSQRGHTGSSVQVPWRLNIRILAGRRWGNDEVKKYI